MEHVPPETFLWLATSLFSNLGRGQSENRRMRRFKSHFGVTPDLCADMWGLCFNRLIPTCRPMHFLWACMFLKSHNTEEHNAGIASCDEDTFRHWVWCVLGVMSQVETASEQFSTFLVSNYCFLDRF